MSVTQDDVAKIAHLARLELLPEELERYTDSLNRILGYMEQLNRLDTAAVQPMFSVVGAGLKPAPTVHADIAITAAIQQKDTVLAQAPESDGQFFIVPQVIS